MKINNIPALTQREAEGRYKDVGCGTGVVMSRLNELGFCLPESSNVCGDILFILPALDALGALARVPAGCVRVDLTFAEAACVKYCAEEIFTDAFIAPAFSRSSSADKLAAALAAEGRNLDGTEKKPPVTLFGLPVTFRDTEALINTIGGIPLSDIRCVLQMRSASMKYERHIESGTWTVFSNGKVEAFGRVAQREEVDALSAAFKEHYGDA